MLSTQTLEHMNAEGPKHFEAASAGVTRKVGEIIFKSEVQTWLCQYQKRFYKV